MADPLFTFGEDPTTWNITFSELHINSNPQVTFEQFQEARGWQRYMDAGNTGDHPVGPPTNTQTMFAQNQLAILVNQEAGDEADDEDEDEDEDPDVGENDDSDSDSSESGGEKDWEAADEDAADEVEIPTARGSHCT